MEETKIWAVEGTAAAQLSATNQMETEGLLEDILTANPDMLEDGLELVGRQTSTVGGPLDLLGVDTDGRLVVYELKRGALNREAVAQAIDYASALDAMDMDRLVSHIEQQSGNLGIEKKDDFAGWYSDNWAGQGLEELMPPRMVLVGLGVDNTTERMVKYMAGSGMDISLLTFHGFINSDGRTLLARNVEVDRANTTDTVTNGGRRRPNYSQQFMERAQSLPQDVQEVLRNAESMFKSQIKRGHRTTTSSTRRHFNLNYTWYAETIFERVATVFIEIDNLEINVGFNPIAIQLVSINEFSKIRSEGSEFAKIETTGSYAPHIGEINYEIKFPLRSLADWEEQKEMLTTLTRKFCEAYDRAEQEAMAKQ